MTLRYKTTSVRDLEFDLVKLRLIHQIAHRCSKDADIKALQQMANALQATIRTLRFHVMDKSVAFSPQEVRFNRLVLLNPTLPNLEANKSPLEPAMPDANMTKLKEVVTIKEQLERLKWHCELIVDITCSWHREEALVRTIEDGSEIVKDVITVLPESSPFKKFLMKQPFELGTIKPILAGCDDLLSDIDEKIDALLSKHEQSSVAIKIDSCIEQAKYHASRANEPYLRKPSPLMLESISFFEQLKNILRGRRILSFIDSPSLTEGKITLFLESNHKNQIGKRFIPYIPSRENGLRFCKYFTSLVLAIEIGDAEVVHKIIELSLDDSTFIDVSEKMLIEKNFDDDDENLLFILQCIFLEKNKKFSFDCTLRLLHFICKSREGSYLKLIEPLIKCNRFIEEYQIYRTNNPARSPVLHLAARNLNFKMLKLLLEHGLEKYDCMDSKKLYFYQAIDSEIASNFDIRDAYEIYIDYERREMQRQQLQHQDEVAALRREVAVLKSCENERIYKRARETTGIDDDLLSQPQLATDEDDEGQKSSCHGQIKKIKEEKGTVRPKSLSYSL